MKNQSPSNLSGLSTRGFSLIEMMVAVAIGMILIVIITTLISRHEAGRRTVASGNEATITAAFASYTLEQDIRNAGSGFSHNNGAAFGCRLRVSRSSSQLLPRSTDFKAPFNSLPRNPFLAPVVAFPGLGPNGSDILLVSSGSGGMGELGYRLNPLARTATSLTFETTLGLTGNDLVLVNEAAVGCLITQVEAGFTGGATTPTLPLGGTYYAASVDGRAVSDYISGRLSLLGNTGANPPRFRAFGIDAASKLFSYDILDISGDDTPSILAEGILDFRVRYGLDTNNNGDIDSWVSPDNALFSPAALQANTNRIQQIIAIRIGFIASGDLVEREEISPEQLVLFRSLGVEELEHTFTLTAAQRRLRVRPVEFTVPIRNSIQINRT